MKVSHDQRYMFHQFKSIYNLDTSTESFDMIHYENKFLYKIDIIKNIQVE